MVLITSLSIFSCSKGSYTIESEVFEKAERPYFEYSSVFDHYYCIPWNYNKTFNSERKYPLVVYLYGAGGAGKISDLNFLGYDTKIISTSFHALEFQLIILVLF